MQSQFRRPGVSGLFRLLAASLAAATLVSAQNSYSIQTAAGSNAVGDNAAAVNALLLQAEGLAFDRTGNLYIADAADHRIRCVRPSGLITTIAGTGTPGYSGDGGQAVSAQLHSPYGIAVDGTGNVLVADLGNRRIRRVKADGTIETVAGGGTADPSDGAAATQVRLDSPRNVAIDSTGAIYFSDFGANRVYKVASGGQITTLAGGGAAGANSDGVLARNLSLLSPAGLAVGAENRIFVAVSGSKRVLRIDRGVAYQVNVPNLITPTGVAVDPAGLVYVADRLRGATAIVLPSGSSGEIRVPGRDVAISGSIVYLSDGRVVRSVTPTGVVAVYAGSSGPAFTGDGGPALSARLSLPSAAAADSSGNVYVADTGNHRIRRIATDGLISSIAGTGESGATGDNGPAASAKLNSPAGIAVDRLGGIYIADTGNHTVRKISGTAITTAAGTGSAGKGGDNSLATASAFSSPSGLVVDSGLNLFIADTGNHRVRRVYPTGVVVTVAGTGTAGSSGDGGQGTAAQLNSPTALALDDAGNLYIADSGNNAVRRLGTDGVVTTVARSQSATWNSPQGVAVAGNAVLVSDTGNHRILRIDSAGAVTVVAGMGAAGLTGDGGPALSARVNAPLGLVVDSGGNILVADSQNHRLRKLSPGSGSGGGGTGGGTGGGGTGGGTGGGGTNPPGEQPLGPATARLLSFGSNQEGAIAPGQLVSIYGSGLGPTQAASGPLLAGTPLPVTLAGVQVTFDGVPAPLLYAHDTQVNVQAPYSLAGKTSTTVSVLFQNATRWTASIPVVDANPALLTTGAGTGPALAVNQDGTMNSAGAAARGTIVTLFATGEGVTAPASVEGRPASLPLAVPAQAVRVMVGDNPAEVVSAAAAPGFVGLLQVAVRLPGPLTPAGTLPVKLLVGNRSSQNGVTVAVR